MPSDVLLPNFYAINKRYWQCSQTEPPKTSGKIAEKAKQKRQIAETNPMKLSNEINGIVERNQWNCQTKPMDLFRENGVLPC